LLVRLNAEGVLLPGPVGGGVGLRINSLDLNEAYSHELQQYKQSTNTPGLWTHAWHPNQCSLVVEDFGVKYMGEENRKYLIDTLEEFYTISKDEKGKK